MNKEMRNKNIATYTALVFVIVIGWLLAGVIFPSLAGPIIIITFCLVSFPLSYVIWGRWLTGYLQDKVSDDSEAENEHLKKYGPHE
ncbi:MAG TPA: hypothetical protein VMM56_13750 [Planctomycetaceae bacterium]|nr:hypothetical protein [Planctomycetaceae bacterium]